MGYLDFSVGEGLGCKLVPVDGKGLAEACVFQLQRLDEGTQHGYMFELRLGDAEGTNLHPSGQLFKVYVRDSDHRGQEIPQVVIETAELCGEATEEVAKLEGQATEEAAKDVAKEIRTSDRLTAKEAAKLEKQATKEAARLSKLVTQSDQLEQQREDAAKKAGFIPVSTLSEIVDGAVVLFDAGTPFSRLRMNHKGKVDMKGGHGTWTNFVVHLKSLNGPADECIYIALQSNPQPNNYLDFSVGEGLVRKLVADDGLDEACVFQLKGLDEGT